MPKGTNQTRWAREAEKEPQTNPKFTQNNEILNLGAWK
jgi:hypothetical protein